MLILSPLFWCWYSVFQPGSRSRVPDTSLTRATLSAYPTAVKCLGVWGRRFRRGATLTSDKRTKPERTVNLPYEIAHRPVAQ